MKKILILPLLLSLISCGNSGTSEVKTEDNTSTLEVIAKVDSTKTDASSGATNRSISTTLNGTMTIPPQNNITITLPISGIISSFTLLPGAHIQKGETIAILKNSEFIDIQQTYLDAVAQTEFLEIEYNRQKTLASQDVTSQKSLQQSKADFLSAKSRKEAMNAKLLMLDVSPQELEKNGIVEQLKIEAPQSGYISEIMVNQGKFIAAGEPICKIINKSQILLSLIAYEQDLSSLKIGQKIEFKANGLDKEIFSATITAIDQIVDPINRSIKVYAKSNDTHANFRPGMYIVAMIK